MFNEKLRDNPIKPPVHGDGRERGGKGLGEFKTDYEKMFLDERLAEEIVSYVERTLDKYKEEGFQMDNLQI